MLPWSSGLCQVAEGRKKLVADKLTTDRRKAAKLLFLTTADTEILAAASERSGCSR
jgi:hypothetical protein